MRDRRRKTSSSPILAHPLRGSCPHWEFPLLRPACPAVLALARGWVLRQDNYYTCLYPAYTFSA
eukprot:5265550-Pyramimonas_sp.AAC.1